MHTLRLGRKLNLPSTIAIKHQVRVLMAQYELEKAEAEARPEVFRGQPSFAVNRLGRTWTQQEGTPQWDTQTSSSTTDLTTAMGCYFRHGTGLRG
jgi:hypothetical protein